MAIQADDDGFLIGKPMTDGDNKKSRIYALWSDIRDEVKNISEVLTNGKGFTSAVKAMNAQAERKSKSTAKSIATAIAKERTNVPRQNSVVTQSRSREASARIAKAIEQLSSSATSPAMPLRDARGRFMRREAAAVPQDAAVTAMAVADAETAATESISTSGRGSNGRFVNRGGIPQVPAEPRQPGGKSGRSWLDLFRRKRNDKESSDGEKKGFWRKLIGDVALSAGGGAARATEGIDQVDPAIAAAKEAGNLIAPVLKPIGTLIGGIIGRRGERKRQKDAARENAKEQHKLALPWYKKMVGGKPVSVGEAAGGGVGGVLGIMSSVLPMLGGLLIGAVPLLIAGAGVLAAGALGAWIGKTIGGWINDKFGTQISDFIFDTSEFIKEKWNDVAAGWDVVTQKASDWIDSVTSAWGTIKEAPGQAKNWVSDKFRAAQSALGFDVPDRRNGSAGGNAGTGKFRNRVDGATDSSVGSRINPQRDGAVIVVPQAANGSVAGDRTRGLGQHPEIASASVMGRSRGVVSPSLPGSAIKNRGTSAPPIDRYSPGKAPDLISNIGSNAKTQAQVQVTVAAPVAQNVGDRRIAQLVTGGIGGSGQ